MADAPYNRHTRYSIDIVWFLRVEGGSIHFAKECFMEWMKPEFTVVAVTMEVTAYAATK